MNVLPGLVQYLQCLAGDFSTTICCHPEELTVRALIMRSSIQMTCTQFEDRKLISKQFVLIKQACFEVMTRVTFRLIKINSQYFL